MTNPNLYSKKQSIALLVMDVDGTLTDGNIYIGVEGEIFKSFNTKDGLGVTYILPQLNIIPAVITGRKSIMLEKRCLELGITELYQGVSDKLSTLKMLISAHNIALSEVAYIGDDLNDLECMQAIQINGGLVGCPFDASRKVIELADFKAEHSGGHGAVRDFIDWLAS